MGPDMGRYLLPLSVDLLLGDAAVEDDYAAGCVRRMTATRCLRHCVCSWTQSKSSLFDTGTSILFLSLWPEDGDEGREDSTGGPQPQFVFIAMSTWTTSREVLQAGRRTACSTASRLVSLQTTGASYFLDHDFLPIPMLSEAKDKFVFRTFERSASSSGMTVWTASPEKPLNTNAAHYATVKAARAAGLLDFRPYSVRRLTINALNRPDVPNATRNMAVGHLPHNDAAQHVYLSRRITVDIVNESSGLTGTN